MHFLLSCIVLLYVQSCINVFSICNSQLAILLFSFILHISFPKCNVFIYLLVKIVFVIPPPGNKDKLQDILYVHDSQRKKKSRSTEKNKDDFAEVQHVPGVQTGSEELLPCDMSTARANPGKKTYKCTLIKNSVSGR